MPEEFVRPHYIIPVMERHYMVVRAVDIRQEPRQVCMVHLKLGELVSSISL